MGKSIPDAAVQSTLKHIAPIHKRSTKTSKANLEEKNAKLLEALEDWLVAFSPSEAIGKKHGNKVSRPVFSEHGNNVDRWSCSSRHYWPCLYPCNHLRHTTKHSRLKSTSRSHHNTTDHLHYNTIWHQHHNRTDHPVFCHQHITNHWDHTNVLDDSTWIMLIHA